MGFDKSNNGSGSLCWTCRPDVFWNCSWVVKSIFPDGCEVASALNSQTGTKKYEVLERVMVCPNHVKEKQKNTTADNLKVKHIIKRRCQCKRVAMPDKLTGKVIEIHPSISEAANVTDIGRQSITANLRGRSKTAGGYVWKYADEMEVTN